MSKTSETAAASEVVSAAAQPKKSATKTAEVKSGPLMYVGPTKPELGLVHDRVEKAMPEAAKRVLDDLPELKRLFVSVRNSSIALEQIRNKSGAYYSAYVAVASYSAAGRSDT